LVEASGTLIVNPTWIHTTMWGVRPSRQARHRITSPPGIVNALFDDSGYSTESSSPLEGSENNIPFRNLEEGESASVKAGETVAKYIDSGFPDSIYMPGNHPDYIHFGESLIRHTSRFVKGIKRRDTCRITKER
jgi:hypothetical protein